VERWNGGTVERLDILSEAKDLLVTDLNSTPRNHAESSEFQGMIHRRFNVASDASRADIKNNSLVTAVHAVSVPIRSIRDDPRPIVDGGPSETIDGATTKPTADHSLRSG
jgi:hypothetical protein